EMGVLHRQWLPIGTRLAWQRWLGGMRDVVVRRAVGHLQATDEIAMRFRFTIRDLLWLTLVVALAVGLVAGPCADDSAGARNHRVRVSQRLCVRPNSLRTSAHNLLLGNNTTTNCKHTENRQARQHER